MRDFEVAPAIVADKIENARPAFYDFPAFLHLAVEYSQGISRQPALAVSAEMDLLSLQELREALPERSPA